MNKPIQKAGYAIVLLGVLVVPFFWAFLPVQLFLEEQSLGDGASYVRVDPSALPDGSGVAVVVVCVGLLLVLLGGIKRDGRNGAGQD